MIARIWKGETPESKADEYFEFLKVTGIKEDGYHLIFSNLYSFAHS